MKSKAARTGVKTVYMFDAPEAQFLSAVVRGDISQRSAECIRELHGKHINWRILSSFYLAPLMYSKTKDFYKGIGIPEDVFETWKNAYFCTLLKNILSLKNIEELAGEFRRRNIELVFLKGAAELVSVYQRDPGICPMSDIDALIRQSDLCRVDAILTNELGYVQTSLKSRFERNYVKPQSLPLDLHWGFFQEGDDFLEFEEDLLRGCFEKKEEVALNHAGVPIPDSTTHLLIRILHGVKREHFKDTTSSLWFLTALHDFDTMDKRQEIDLIELSCKIRQILRYATTTIDWSRITRSFQGLEKDLKLRRLFAVCRFCGITEIPESFYSVFKVPARVSRSYYKRLIRDRNRSIVTKSFSRMLAGESSFRIFLVFLLAYLIGARNYFILRHNVRKLFRSFHPGSPSHFV